MTAETDALRLVPVKSTGAMQAAGRDALEPFVGALKQPVEDQWHLARLVWDAMLAAAPAVQPAAGREPVAWPKGALLRVVRPPVSGDGWEGKNQPPLNAVVICDGINPNGNVYLRDYEPDFAWHRSRFVTYDPNAAPAVQPAAQGSESGPTCQRCGGEIHGWCCQSCDAEFRENDAGKLVFDEDAALSQPGPASEGEAAPVSPDLLKEAVGLLRDWRAIWFCSADARSERVVARDTDAFLSKVEERGHD